MKQCTKEQALSDRSSLLRAWRNWHREQLEAALAGVHGAVLERLMAQLKNLRSARALVDFINTQDWAAVDDDTRLIALHEINNAIVQLRERTGQAPIDDGLPGEAPRAFQVIKEIINNQFPALAGRPQPGPLA